ncbi:protein OSB4, chloroplastic-like isoform X2 [Prunus dulcis]|uniref:protein OSB4, chloroplastic-like isoform X2 n=1 Tax=Prunus dulcis TaxID=3755 RepID=UPI001483548B|nr:protein OSB4, chloroplastic-like isoform X2 [Prunus dulcis]
MNSICRAITTKKRLLPLRPLQLLQSHYATTTGKTKPKTQNTKTITKPPPSEPPRQPPPKVDWPRPVEVPFQPKVANSVRLIGHVHTPLQSQATPDGNLWAATILSSSSSSSHPLKMPIIFEGDLAHIASLHLKENDFVFVAGSLRSDLLHLNASKGQTPLQVMVHTLYFVEESSQTKKSSKDDRQEEKTIDHTAAGVKEDVEKSWKNLLTWKDLLAKPHEWWDIRLKEDNPKAAAFERKNNGEVLRIDDSTPEWIRNKLDSTTFDQKPISDSCETSLKKDGDSTLGPWRDLLDNPKQWRDYRKPKLNGLVNPNYPDFKSKDGSHALWLNKAPQPVLSELEGMEFGVQIQKSKQAKESRGDESWKDLVENPGKWWDNRLEKRNKNGPDFKHKETGEALWLSSSPAWVLPKLPPLRTKQAVTIGNTPPA